MASASTSDDGDMGFQIAPMVDVVFVLLLFFMAVAGTQQATKELSINLPSYSHPQKLAISIPIIIDISATGQVTVNNQSFDMPGDKSLPQLKAWLLTIFSDEPAEDNVIVRPADDVPHERVIDVLN